MARRVSDDALGNVAHHLRRDRRSDGKRQEAGCDDRHDRYRAEIDPFQTGIGFVDPMQDQVRLVVEQTLPWSGDGLVVDMQSRRRPLYEEGAQYSEQLRTRTKIADDDA